MKRKYELKKRAERQDETRRRITDAAVELHGTIGPARTTISAVAERARVQRLTVYRHFPDETALFEACSSHWISLHPPPDPGRWAAIDAGEERLRVGLRELYSYYRDNREMIANVLRDGPSVPALAPQLAGWSGYVGHACEILGGRRPGRRAAAALGHALDFSTWESLSGRRLSDAEAVELMSALVQTARG
jgi:AcrR family transcriptional regulator